MKHNVIALNVYRDTEPFDYAGWNRRAEARFRAAQLRRWIVFFLDAVTTLAITGCTVFCCWLALLML